MGHHSEKLCRSGDFPTQVTRHAANDFIECRGVKNLKDGASKDDAPYLANELRESKKPS